MSIKQPSFQVYLGQSTQ